MSSYVKLEDLLEPCIEKFKSELEELAVFTRVSEGEYEYEKGYEAWVIPGPNRIVHSGMSHLTHVMTIYVIFLASATDAKHPDLRKIGERAYDKLMEDITHGGTCRKSIPSLFHPGYIQDGEELCVGILSNWETEFRQAYVLPTS